MHWSMWLGASGWSNPALATRLLWDLGLVSYTHLLAVIFLSKMRGLDRMGIFQKCVFTFSYGTLSSNEGSSGSPENKAEELRFLWWKLG